MNIINSDKSDISKIFEMYRVATEYMKSKNQVAWPEFEKDMIVKEIEESRQWKLLINGEIACIWATTLDDELIWGEENNTPSLYIHRITTSPEFRGRNLVKHVVNWADEFCVNKDLKYIRMDTAGLNKGLIGHYGKLGFDLLGSRILENTDGLPDHYRDVPICLFQRVPQIKIRK